MRIVVSLTCTVTAMGTNAHSPFTIHNSQLPIALLIIPRVLNQRRVHQQLLFGYR